MIPEPELAMRQNSPYQKRYEVACDKGFVTWDFLRCGYQKRLIGEEQVIKHAVDMVTSTTRVPDPVLTLAGAETSTEREIEELLASLSLDATCSGKELDRWRLCVLIQIRDAYADDPDQLLRMVDDVYSLFDYPPDMRRAVTYMPVEGSAQAKIGDIVESPITALDEIIDQLNHELVR
jgi:hypothetical protein